MSAQTPLTRINLTGSLQDLLSELCIAYDIGNLNSFSVIETGYEDCNIILKTDKGKFLAKVFAKTRDDADISRYVDVIYNAVAVGVRHPRILKDTEGSTLFTGHGVKLVVLEFVEGKTFYELGRMPSDEELRAIIVEAAKINSMQYNPPYIFDSWAVPHILKMYEKVRQYLSPPDLTLADKALEQFKQIPLDELPKAFVHGDLIQTNVLKGDDGNIYVLDFSVANTYPRIQELAVMASSLLSGTSLQGKCEKLIEQYDKINPLTDAEKQHLYAYALAGTAMELLGGHQEKYINGVDTAETDHWIEVGRQGLKDALQEKIC